MPPPRSSPWRSSITAFASTYGGLLGASRVPYAAALDGDFLAPFARLHPTKRFPHVSLVALGLHRAAGDALSARRRDQRADRRHRAGRAASATNVAVLVAARGGAEPAPFRAAALPAAGARGARLVALLVLEFGSGRDAASACATLALGARGLPRARARRARLAVRAGGIARCSRSSVAAAGADAATFTHARIVQRDGTPQLLVDGKPFFFFGGAFFYERIPPERWRASMLAMRALGANTLDLYVPWNWHEVADGRFDFDGHTNPRRNLRRVLQLARELGFHLIVRPGAGDSQRMAQRRLSGLAARRARTTGCRCTTSSKAAIPRPRRCRTRTATMPPREWLRNPTHRRYAARWLRHALAEFVPYADLVIAVALDDDQGAYIDNQTWPAPHLQAYLQLARRRKCARVDGSGRADLHQHLRHEGPGRVAGVGDGQLVPERRRTRSATTTAPSSDFAARDADRRKSAFRSRRASFKPAGSRRPKIRCRVPAAPDEHDAGAGRAARLGRARRGRLSRCRTRSRRSAGKRRSRTRSTAGMRRSPRDPHAGPRSAAAGRRPAAFGAEIAACGPAARANASRRRDRARRRDQRRRSARARANDDVAAIADRAQGRAAQLQRARADLRRRRPALRERRALARATARWSCRRSSRPPLPAIARRLAATRARAGSRSSPHVPTRRGSGIVVLAGPRATFGLAVNWSDDRAPLRRPRARRRRADASTSRRSSSAHAARSCWCWPGRAAGRPPRRRRRRASSERGRSLNASRACAGPACPRSRPVKRASCWAPTRSAAATATSCSSQRAPACGLRPRRRRATGRLAARRGSLPLDATTRPARCATTRSCSRRPRRTDRIARVHALLSGRNVQPPVSHRDPARARTLKPSCASRYDAPDVVPHGARFEKTVQLRRRRGAARSSTSA